MQGYDGINEFLIHFQPRQRLYKWITHTLPTYDVENTDKFVRKFTTRL